MMGVPYFCFRMPIGAFVINRGLKQNTKVLQCPYDISKESFFTRQNVFGILVLNFAN